MLSAPIKQIVVDEIQQEKKGNNEQKNRSARDNNDRKMRRFKNHNYETIKNRKRWDLFAMIVWCAARYNFDSLPNSPNKTIQSRKRKMFASFLYAETLSESRKMFIMQATDGSCTGIALTFTEKFVNKEMLTYSKLT